MVYAHIRRVFKRLALRIVTAGDACIIRALYIACERVTYDEHFIAVYFFYIIKNIVKELNARLLCPYFVRNKRYV